MLLMVVLIFGKTVQQDFTAVGVQLIYVALYWLLLTYLDRNTLSVDAWRVRRSHGP